MAKGHTLVIPKKHYRWVWDIENLEAYWSVCKKIANHFQLVTKQELVVSTIFGEEVKHAHVHIFPSFTQARENKILGQFMNFRGEKIAENNAQKLVELLKLDLVDKKFFVPS